MLVMVLNFLSDGMEGFTFFFSGFAACMRGFFFLSSVGVWGLVVLRRKFYAWDRAGFQSGFV